MGDRANVFIMQGKNEGVYLYTHWSGYNLPQTLQAALKKQMRWGDSYYLARIIFCEMVKGHEMEETGYGISSIVGDGDDRILIVDPDTQTVKIKGKRKSWSFEEFCTLSDKELKALKF